LRGRLRPSVLTRLIDRVIYEDKRLERKENKALAGLEEASRKAEEVVRRSQELSARLRRLRKQRQLIKEKGLKMVRNRLKDMDTLEAREEEERRALLAGDPVVALDWSSLGLELPVGLDFGGGTPGVLSGSSI